MSDTNILMTLPHCLSIQNHWLEIEYFNLGINPIYRETYRLGDVKIKEKGYFITESCIGCGTCKKMCPQKCIDEGSPFSIRQNNCLHCGNCYENCPVKSIERR